MIWAAFFLPFFAVALLIPQARKMAVLVRFVDKPGGRKQHHKPVPPIGGLVIFPIFMMVSYYMGADMKYFAPLYVGLAVLLLTGAYDEYVQVPAWIKFFIQVGVALLVVL